MPRKRKAAEAAPSQKASAQEKVGKGKPPSHTRFVKGVSGNPKGRPKGSKNVATILQEVADDYVVATIGGKQRKISKLYASALQLGTQAASGKPWAVDRFLKTMDEIQRRAAAAKPAEFPFAAADLEILHAIYERMLLCTPPEAK